MCMLCCVAWETGNEAAGNQAVDRDRLTESKAVDQDRFSTLPGKVFWPGRQQNK